MESSYDSTSDDGDLVDFSRLGGWTSWSSLLVVLAFLAPLAALCLVLPVLVVSIIFPGGFWLWMAVYLVVPALLIIPGLESLQAWFVSTRSRRPSPEEQARLAPLWDRVLARVGEGKRRRYRLRVSDDPRTTASAAGGSLVTVTTGALAGLADDELEAVLAQGFGHQVGLRPFVLLAQQWLARPLGWAARLSAAMQNMVGSPARGQSRQFAYLLRWTVVLVMRAVRLALDSMAMAARLVLSFLGQRAEYRADAVAVRLGYGPPLMAALAAPETQPEAEPADDRRRRFGLRRRRQQEAESDDDQTPDRAGPLWDTRPESADRIARIRDSIGQ